MFREMRRKTQQLDKERCEELLASAHWGVLSVLGDKFNPGHEGALSAEVERGHARLHMLKMDIEHMSGKRAIELVPKNHMRKE